MFSVDRLCSTGGRTSVQSVASSIPFLLMPSKIPHMSAVWPRVGICVDSALVWVGICVKKKRCPTRKNAQKPIAANCKCNRELQQNRGDPPHVNNIIIM